MNEYTRREEIRWILVTVAVLVLSVAIAIVRLVLAQGPMVADPKAIEAGQAARKAADDYQKCGTAAEKLSQELGIFNRRHKTAVENAEKAAEQDRVVRRLPKAEPPKPQLRWKIAQNVHKQAKALDECREPTEEATGADEDAKRAWDAVTAAARLKAPVKADKKAEETKTARLHDLLADAPLDKLKAQVDDATKKLGAAAEAAQKTAETKKVQAPLPDGLFPMGAAIGVGVGVALAALIISYVSVRSASMRRARTLVALRRFANTPEAGLQAAAIVRLAAHHNGGEPGMVVGSAVGGLLAALIFPSLSIEPDTYLGDLFVAGSMGGLLVGLAGQWLVRSVAGQSRWRERAKELGEIEKPTIPVVLVLGGVTPGLEKQFLRYFDGLPPADAAVVVQKLAAQAEEQILAAAGAGRAMAPAAAPPGGGAWGAGPPGAAAPGGYAPTQ
ncbi:MAG: hypothetical protein HY744_26360 [Deltaproteobacteria bacterium]|nr:hypothetical protein [Deltaproteobacteria bacterium]